ncbi:TetR/AcrR family transcriptional regulator [Nocardia sp. NPDC052566]|uniref:TetR/AcrR family transcriptional regulator n=1 Tax=Nocardia sp. NPDC052566 TaxID=3364330 RepID=UPI0037CBA8CB
MDKANGQSIRPSSAVQGAATRAAIIDATVALIGEVGWGGITLRAVAARAGVRHGVVGYHFRGKDDLLGQAAAAATRQVLAQPLALARQATDIHQVVEGTVAWYSCGGLSDPSMALLLEILRQGVRDSGLRAPIAAEIRAYRAALADLIENGQRRGELTARVPAADAATVLAALLDGLLLHALFDPDLNLNGTAVAVRTLLARGATDDTP